MLFYITCLIPHPVHDTLVGKRQEAAQFLSVIRPFLSGPGTHHAIGHSASNEVSIKDPPWQRSPSARHLPTGLLFRMAHHIHCAGQFFLALEIQVVQFWHH